MCNLRRTTCIVDFEFVCDNGNHIKDADKLCDNSNDCGDNSDETKLCARTVKCSFESRHYCGYTLIGWVLDTGLASLLSPPYNTGPSFDHTAGLVDGIHKYMVTTQNGASLVTPEHTATGDSCLRFYYYLSYNSKIEVRKLPAGSVHVVDGATDFWRQATVPMTAGTYSLEFKAVISRESYIAIDDVILESGSCSQPCPANTFTCQSDTTCLPIEYACDGLPHCADSSDEINCPAIDEVKCSFDKAFACGIRQSNDDDFNWNVRYGYFGFNTGLPAGHSDGTDNEGDPFSSYMVAVAPKSYAKTAAVWPLNLAQPACMTVWVYMHGTQVGSLEIVSDGVAQWQQFGSQGQQWVRVRVPVGAGNAVEFRAQSGNKVHY